MAKSNFERSKPHVNIGASSSIISDTSGQLSVEGITSDAVGAQFKITAPKSETTQLFVLGYPFDNEFFISPTRDRPVLSLDYQVDLIPLNISTVSQMTVTLALRQEDQYFLASSVYVVNPTDQWLTFSDVNLTSSDFYALGDGRQLPDFSQAFNFGIAVSGEYGGMDTTESLAVEYGMDNIQVSILSVPEPSSIVLVAAMGVVLLKQRWRRM
jgi:hypothetical protein